jgi:hypothetical protein
MHYDTVTSVIISTGFNFLTQENLFTFLFATAIAYWIQFLDTISVTLFEHLLEESGSCLTIVPIRA